MKILTRREKMTTRNGVIFFSRRFYKDRIDWDHLLAIVEYTKTSTSFNISIGIPDRSLLKEKDIDGLSIWDDDFRERRSRIKPFIHEYILNKDLASKIYKFLLRDLDRLGWLDGSL